MSQKTIRPFHIIQKALKHFLKVIYCTQQLQVRENVVGFEKALGAVKVIKDQIQYRSQSLLNLAHDYFSNIQLHCDCIWKEMYQTSWIEFSGCKYCKLKFS